MCCGDSFYAQCCLRMTPDLIQQPEQAWYLHKSCDINTRGCLICFLLCFVQ